MTLHRFLVLLSFDIWLAVACAYDVAGHYLLQKREYFNHGVGGMLSDVWIASTVAVLATLVVYENRDCMEGINKILKFQTKR
ncbi:unnamed protein product [Orchesella dallaii]|uniref:Uncharacterized protein n=1 Tax=Orchesella dallaii TaxID=48710 RepID=A0ABP1QUV8_9HEXA